MRKRMPLIRSAIVALRLAIPSARLLHNNLQVRAHSGSSKAMGGRRHPPSVRTCSMLIHEFVDNTRISLNLIILSLADE